MTFHHSEHMLLFIPQQRTFMKSTVKVICYVGIILAILAAITLGAWLAWQVLPENPHPWQGNLPTFPLALWVWLAGVTPVIIAAFVLYVGLLILRALFGWIFRRIRASVGWLLTWIAGLVRRKA